MRSRVRRRIAHRFPGRFFKPRGVPLHDLEEIEISHDELEALRLRYINGFSQADAAKRMGISQSQYQRDLWKANKKITQALIEGYAIKVDE